MNLTTVVPSSPPCVHYVPNFITEAEEEYLLRKISETPQPKWRNVSNRSLNHQRLQIWGGELSSKSGTLLPSPMPPFFEVYPDIIPRLGALGIFDKTGQGKPNHIIVNQYTPGQGIMPHEDGPVYHPVVATISLGSHAVLNYYRYETDDPDRRPDQAKERNASSPQDETCDGPMSRPIHPKPVVSLLLEPRSLVVTSEDLYCMHLHGINAVAMDHLIAHESDKYSEAAGEVQVANWNMLGGDDAEIMRVVREGGILKRETRTSLTCRVVEKVASSRIGSLLIT